MIDPTDANLTKATLSLVSGLSDALRAPHQVANMIATATATAITPVHNHPGNPTVDAAASEAAHHVLPHRHEHDDYHQWDRNHTVDHRRPEQGLACSNAI